MHHLNHGVLEVHHGAVVTEEVDLLDAGDVVHAEALQRVLKPLVIYQREVEEVTISKRGR